MTPKLFVKICGITGLADAECAVEAGADALGFIFYPKSPRFLDLEKARHLFRNLPRGTRKVGVFVNEPRDTLERYLEDLQLDYVQLHGDESPKYCSTVKAEIIKGLRVKDMGDLSGVGGYRVSYFLLDTFSEKEFGGTGKVFDWRIALEAKEVLPAQIILSGGLNPENVSEAVRTVRPFGVDVSSGVEKSPGRKDHDKVREFIRRAREAERNSGESD